MLPFFKHFDQPWDFSLLDSGNGFRLETWGQYTLKRPDPQAIWQPATKEWKYDAEFTDTWHTIKKVPETFDIKFKDVKFKARLTPFKHTGIFAEQSAHWEDFYTLKKPIKILNLFGYTGCATIVLSKLGHFVTHVDASKPSIAWAKENQKLNNLPQDAIRWICDDARDFVRREITRGNTYDAILLDPPAYGKSPKGKTWKFEKDFPKLLEDCKQILTKDYSFVLVNAYATNMSALGLYNIMQDALKSNIIAGELCLQQKSGRLLSTGIFASSQRML